MQANNIFLTETVLFICEMPLREDSATGLRWHAEDNFVGFSRLLRNSPRTVSRLYGDKAAGP